MKNDLKNLLFHLLSFQTDTQHPEEIAACFAYITDWFKRQNLIVKSFESDGKPSFVVSRKDKRHYKYLMIGHIDVVPASYSDAFSPKIDSTRVYARGAADMKGTVAAMMLTMKKLKNADTALMLTSDEEVGGYNGIYYLLNNEGYSGECAIIPDGGNNFHLTLDQKGILQIQIKSKGKAAHGSRPWMGDNAINQLINTYVKIKENFKDNNADEWITTMNLGKISGGTATNMVPESAELSLDFRYISTQDKEKILSLLQNITKQNKNITYTSLIDGSMMHTTIDNPHVQRLLSTAKRYNITLDTEKTPTASDGRFFTDKGIPVLMFNPICSQGHIEDEWIDLLSLDVFQKILEDFLNDL